MNLANFQELVAAELRTMSELSDVDVLTERKGDIASMLDVALGKMGLCAVVLTPFAKVAEPNLPGPELDPLSVTVAVFEDVALADDAAIDPRTAFTVALAALQRLHHWAPPGFPRMLTAANNALVLVPDPALLVYHANLETSLVLEPRSDPRRIP